MFETTLTVNEAELSMLRFALTVARDLMLSEPDGFTNEDEQAYKSLHQLAEGAAGAGQ